MNILAIGAHPDDIEFLCSGTLAKFSKEGHNVFNATLSCGNQGSFEIPPKKLGRIRIEEARKAAEVIGAQYEWLSLYDMEIYLNNESVNRIIEHIRKVKADIIITTDPNDYHPDHMAASSIVTYALFGAGLPHLDSDFPPYTPKRLYYCDTVFGLDFKPEYWIDISNTIDLKVKALSEHKSQIEWVQKHHGIDLLEDVRTFSRFRGLQSGVKYAEAFRNCNKHMYMGPIDQLPI